MSKMPERVHSYGPHTENMRLMDQVEALHGRVAKLTQERDQAEQEHIALAEVFRKLQGKFRSRGRALRKIDQGCSCAARRIARRALGEEE